MTVCLYVYIGCSGSPQLLYFIQTITVSIQKLIFCRFIETNFVKKDVEMYQSLGTPLTSVPPPPRSYTDPGPGQGYQQSGYSSYGNYRKPFTYNNYRQNPRGDRRSDPGGYHGGAVGGGNHGYSGGYSYNQSSENYYGRTNNRGKILIFLYSKSHALNVNLLFLSISNILRFYV